jgi:PhoH-like ATPase
LQEIILDDQAVSEYYSAGEKGELFLKKYLEKNYDPVVNDSFIIKSNDLKIIWKGKYKGKIHKLREVAINEFKGVKLSSDIEQQFVIDDILDKDIKLITVVGHAGTGKTFISLLGSLAMSDKVIYTREVVGVGRSLGLLPGELEEKFAPYLAGLWSNIDAIEELTFERVGEKVEPKPIEYMRGANIKNKYLIVDEAQNADKHILKTLISRAGEGCKVILCGSMEQIDDKSLRGEGNGFKQVIKAFRGVNLFSNNNLTKDKRSRLAMLADKLL